MQDDELIGGDVDITDYLEGLSQEAIEGAFIRALERLDWDIEQAQRDPHNPTLMHALKDELCTIVATTLYTDAMERLAS